MNCTIAECLGTLHQEIVTSWNIYYPNEASNLSLFLMTEYRTASLGIYLFHSVGLPVSKSQFSEQIKTLVQYVTPEVEQAKSML
jgi:hypothetical protein